LKKGGEQSKEDLFKKSFLTPSFLKRRTKQLSATTDGIATFFYFGDYLDTAGALAAGTSQVSLNPPP